MIVYEGYEEPTPEQTLVDEPTPPEPEQKPVMEDDSHSGGNCSYDADASNDSIELNLSLHEDTDRRKGNNHHPSQHPLKQYSNHLTNVSDLQVVNNSSTTIEVTSEDNDNSARGTTPFIPISEETIFLDTDHMEPVTSSGISTMSSPVSCDSWMNYSSNSSDDLSCISDRIHVQQDSSEESSLEYDTPLATAQSTPKFKRNFNSALLNAAAAAAAECSQSDGARRKTSYSTAISKTKPKPVSNATEALVDGDCPTTCDEDLDGGHTKRLRGKSSKTTAGSGSSTGGSIKRKSVHRNNSTGSAICDIRMIDFAHTAFVRKNIDVPLPPSTLATVQHQGPDNGFLRGIESLKRLLNEILNDIECK